MAGRSRRCAFVVLVALAAVSAASAAGLADATAAATAESNETASADGVLLHVELTPDGDARWELKYTYRLETDEQARAFEQLREDVESNPATYEADLRDTIGGAVDRARNQTGREMRIEDVDVSARRQEFPDDTGFVTYRFTWTNFSRQNGTTLLAGDAIDALFLDEKTDLEVAWPEGYRAVSVSPDPDETRTGSVAWNGRTNFVSGEPRIELREREPTPTATTVVTDATGDGGDATATTAETTRTTSASDSSDVTSTEAGADPGEAGSDDSPPLVAIGTALAAVVLVGTLGVVVRGRGEEGEESDEEEVSEELLSREERVVRALEEHGGRMKQGELADRLDWPAPKTSRVIGDLREDEVVDVFRIGRENVVTLPGYDLLDDQEEP